MRSRYQSRYQPRTASKYAGRGPAAQGEGVGVPPLPDGFAYVRFSDGAYERWPDGAYVVEYVG